ncbi:uncharacterized protein LOC144884387 [Branchiostoma floridae x Branchiostoma japonicum]
MRQSRTYHALDEKNVQTILKRPISVCHVIYLPACQATDPRLSAAGRSFYEQRRQTSDRETWRTFEIRLPERQKAMGNEHSSETVTDKGAVYTTAAVDMEGFGKETAATTAHVVPKTFSSPAPDDNSIDAVNSCKQQ